MTIAAFSGIVLAQYLGCTRGACDVPMRYSASRAAERKGLHAEHAARDFGLTDEILEVHTQSDSISTRCFRRELLAKSDGFRAEGVVLGVGQIGAPQPDIVTAGG